MPIEGSLRDFALHDIFQLLHLSRKTGELKVVREPAGTRATVVFDVGAVVAAGIAEATPRLGYMLLNAGKVTEADLRRATEIHAQAPERGWGEIFASLEVVEAKDLEKYVKFQVEEFVYEILDWGDGHFVFGERPLAESDRVTWISVESLLMEGARRADELSALSTTIESPRAVPRLSERAASERGVLDLTPQEWEVVGRVDGFSDVKSIAWTLGRSEFEVSKVLSTLAEKGVLEIGSQERSRARAPIDVLLDEVEDEIDAGQVEAARQQLETVLDENRDEPRAHYLAGRVRERGGDLKGAAKGYETALDLDPLAEEARRRLGLVRLKLGDIDGAASEWTAYLRMVTDGPDRRQVERALTAVRELQVIVDELDGRESN